MPGEANFLYNTVESQTLTDYNKLYGVNSSARLYGKFGVHISFTHTVSLNSHYGNWEEYWQKIRNSDAPELLLANQAALEEFWRYNIQCLVRNGIDPLWGIAFRGHGDLPFWDRFADAPDSMEERADIINTMVRRQVDILKEETGNPSPTMKMTFYNEVSDFLAQGLLTPPDEENLIWNFVAARRDHYPNDDIQTIDIPGEMKLGYYLNLQFTSTGSHLAPAEGPWKMERNIRYVNGKNSEPIHFIVLNAGNFREYLLTLSAAGDMLWDPQDYDTDSFLLDYSRMYFGSEHAQDIADLYHDYFYSYWRQKQPQLQGFDRQFVFQDLRYKQAVRQIEAKFETFEPNPLKDYSSEQVPNRTFRIVPEDNGCADQVSAIIKGTTKSRDDFAEVVRKANVIQAKLDAEVSVFFYDNLNAYAQFMMNINDTLLNFVQAYQSSDQAARCASLENSLKAALRAKQSLLKTAHGPFITWYDNDSIFNLEDFVDKIKSTFLKFQWDSTCMYIGKDATFISEEGEWLMVFPRLAAIPRDSYIIQWSNNLLTWLSNGLEYQEPLQDDVTVLEQVAFNSSESEALFVRFLLN